MFDLIFQARAVHFIDGLPQELRDKLHHSIECLRVDPWVDNVTKFTLAYPPLVFSLYHDGPFQIVYRLKGNTTVDILLITTAPKVPPIREWDAWRKN